MKTKRAERVGCVRKLWGVLENYQQCWYTKKSRRGGYINIHSRRRRLDVREALSLRLSEFIREFPLSQTVINAITTAGVGGTFPSLPSPSPRPPYNPALSGALVGNDENLEERDRHKQAFGYSVISRSPRDAQDRGLRGMCVDPM